MKKLIRIDDYVTQIDKMFLIKIFALLILFVLELDILTQ